MTEGVWWLFLSIALSSIGLGLFLYGKKQTRIPQLIGGILLMGYPFFVSNLWLMSGIGVALLVLVWVAVRLGY